jgi:nitrate/TMAO reductase-like tetraheme cytochrome c subunit
MIRFTPSGCTSKSFNSVSSIVETSAGLITTSGFVSGFISSLGFSVSVSVFDAEGFFASCARSAPANSDETQRSRRVLFMVAIRAEGPLPCNHEMLAPASA